MWVLLCCLVPLSRSLSCLSLRVLLCCLTLSLSLSFSLSLSISCLSFCPLDKVPLFKPSSFEMLLIEAVRNNNGKEVTRLLHIGANPCEVDKDGWTPLHIGPEPDPLTSNPQALTPYPQPHFLDPSILTPTPIPKPRLESLIHNSYP